jgi:Predicted membrane protein (DUF2142)
VTARVAGLRGPNAVAALVVAAFVLLGTAWLVGNPPGAAPDEPAHYLKALAAGHGELYLGRKPPPAPDAASRSAAERWLATNHRLVRVPAGLAPTPLACNAFQSEVSAACLDAPVTVRITEAGTSVGPYQPFTYVLPGLLMRLAADPESATRWGRLGFWLVSAVLLGLAVFLVWSPAEGGWSLVGLLVATTPMVVFMVSVLSANGLEIAAGLGFGAALLRVARPGTPPGWAWAAAGMSGATLALSRVTGVVWLGVIVIAVVALVGWSEARAVARAGGRRALAAAVAMGGAVVATVAWEIVVQPRPRRSLGAAVRGLPDELRELPDTYEQVIGVFGWLDSPLPREAFWAWTGLLLTLLGLALVVGSRRQRLVVSGLVAGSVVTALALATANRPTGFPIQGRYVLPFLTVVALVAGEVVQSNRERLPGVVRALAVPAFAAVAGAVQVVAWYFNGRRYAVGTAGPRWFIGRDEWSPPLGWVPWLVVTVTAAALLMTAATLASRQPPANRQSPPC